MGASDGKQNTFVMAKSIRVGTSPGEGVNSQVLIGIPYEYQGFNDTLLT